MPTVSRYFIKAGLLYLVAALALAVAIAWPDDAGLPSWFRALNATSLHLFVVGWITQIIFGVAIWFFPNASRENPRGSKWLNWGCFATLNLGLAIRAVAEFVMGAGYRGIHWQVSMTIAAVFHLLAALLFAITIWPRVKGRKRRRGG